MSITPITSVSSGSAYAAYGAALAAGITGPDTLKTQIKQLTNQIQLQQQNNLGGDLAPQQIAKMQGQLAVLEMQLLTQITKGTSA